MQIIDLEARNNQDFQLTLDMSAWIAAGYDLGPASKIRMEARKTAADATVQLFLSNQPADAAHGTVTLQGSNLVFAVPKAAIATRVPAAASLVYDAQIATAAGRVVDLFGGALVFDQGISR